MKSFYITKIFFPWMNEILRNPEIGDFRSRLLSHVKGTTLEIGFGTGLNLPFYPNNIESIIAIDPFQGGISYSSSKPVYEFHKMNAEELGFPDSTFDTVVSTFTLCSVKDIVTVLDEVQRVLKPDGRFLFLEHGKSWIKPFTVIQNIANPFFRVFAAGCNVNRDIEKDLTNNGFCLKEMQHIRFQRQIISGFYYLGVATKVN
ncbi:MAG: class I SAM-dependent methyltransferase [Anaerolineaceae bacterium]